MLKILCFTCLVVFLDSFNPSSAQNGLDVQHYKFELALNDKTDTIYGKAEIRIKFSRGVNSFPVDLVLQNAKGKGMVVDNVSVNGTRVRGVVKETDHLIVSLSAGTGSPGGDTGTSDSAIVDVVYHGVPADGLIISKNRYGERTFFADNWPNRAHHWIPCRDEPGDKASFEFIVTAPAHYRVVSNGRLAEEKLLTGNSKLTHWVEDVALPTKVMVIGVARFAVKLFGDSPVNIPVTAWTYPQDSANGFRNYSPAPSILKFFSEYIGLYPYNKLANVQSKTIFGGMENASAIFYYEESAEENKSLEDILAHEIAHQWFGDMATEKNFSQLWLSEGFATYMTDIYLEAKYGTDSMNRRLAGERKEAADFARHSARAVVDSLSPPMALLNANSYQKGGWILHMLRNEIGDSAFRECVRRYYDRYQGRNANTADLEAVAEEVSHKNLRQFFLQWLYTPGIPLLSIRWMYNDKDRSVTISVDQLQPNGPFQFPLQIKLEGDSASRVVVLDIARRSETFSVPSGSLVKSIEADPKTVLLFESRIEKINP